MTDARRFDAEVAALDAGVGLTTLASGLRVTTDPMPEAHSASIAVFVGVGSRDEPETIAGASHFLEHLAFKGTRTRSAREINRAVDALGGDFNAYTSKESTVFMVRVPDDAQREALDVLLDVVCNPRLDSVDVDIEREVILEELAAAEDNPGDVVVDNLMAGLFPDHPLGREIIGTERSLGDISVDDLAGFHRGHYRPGRVVIAAAGAVEHDQMVDAASRWEDAGDRPDAMIDTERIAPGPPDVAPHRVARPIEQLHLALGWRSVAAGSPERFALAVLSHVLGDGPSSRLYERIREDRGLAYSIGSGFSSHVDSGAFSVQCATSPAHLAEVREIVDGCIAELIEDGPSDDELRGALGYLRGSIRVGLEDSAARMLRVGSELATMNRITSLADTLAAIEAVDAADVRGVGRTVMGGDPIESVVGPTAG